MFERKPLRAKLGVHGPPYERFPVSCEIDGQQFKGHYWIAGMILVVSTAHGGTSRQLGEQQPEELAQQLLRQFILNQLGRKPEMHRPA